MKRSLLCCLLILVSCVPATEQRPVDLPPVTYQGSKEAVYANVLQTVSSDPGVPSYNPGGVDGYERGPSGPWMVTSSGLVAGVVTAQAESGASGFLGSNAEPDVHEIEVRFSVAGEAQTRVSVQGTPQAQGLAERIYAELDAGFERLR